jgi:energy-converting hydrogenase A subunit M
MRITLLFTNNGYLHVKTEIAFAVCLRKNREKDITLCQ